ncbi:MAG: flagellar biosynthesis repressor FlbT [Desulfobacteraceae bacterium]|jgi:flagellar biosynthesis repressor protein FlbT
MALKITLKPHEKMILGGAVITNGSSKCEFVVENKVSILRQNNIMVPEKATSPARRIYLAIQLMYVDPSQMVAHQKTYWQLVKEFVDAAPSSLGLVDQINECIFQENYYEAIKLAKQLIEFEQEVIKRVTQCSEILPVG